ncbi:MAG: hypothetical protein ACI4OZ_09205 [Akkermansia sp.]
MKESLIQSIINHIFGRKYYANIVNTRGTFRCELTSQIFRTRRQAEQHRRTIASTYTYSHIETVTFRSHQNYD